MRAVTPSGNLTVRSSGPEVVTEGTRVTDRRHAIHGTVVRVFGPVARPYLAVRLGRPPAPADGFALLGTVIETE